MSFAEAWTQAQATQGRSYEEDIFWESLYPHARPFARVMWSMWPGYFENDMEMIRRVGTATSVREVRFEIDNYRYQHREFGLFRRGFKLRVSGQRVVKLAQKVMS